MHVWHPVQVHSARDNRWAAAGVGALIMGLLLLTIALLESCTNPCHDYYRFDGREPDKAAGVRPFYKVRECDGQPAVDLCDDYTVLPTEHCR